MPIKNPRRTRRIAAKQQEILEAAAKVFAQKGYRHTNIHDVAEAADIADGTIYNYFENKAALLEAIIRQLSELEQQPILSLNGPLEEIIHTRIDALKDKYDLVTAVFPEILGTPELRRKYLDQFVIPVSDSVEKEILQLKKKESEDVDAHLAARLLVAAVLGLQVLIVLGDPTTQSVWNEPEKLAQVWARFISFGLRPTKNTPSR